MLYTEFKLDDALAVRYEEGCEEGFVEGQRENTLKIARNALAEGSTPEFVQKITGLDLETIKELRN